MLVLTNPKLVDVRGIPDEVRYRIFDYLWSRGVRTSNLGIDSTYANKVRNRRIRVSRFPLREND
ncbi:MAG: hypothetical protein ACO2O2_05880 [Acidilobaceae archaeon]